MIQSTEMTFKCLHCFRTFTIPYALKRHISEKHQYNTNKDEEEAFQSNILYEELSLWDKEETFQLNILTYEELSLWDEDFTMNYAKVISQSIIIITKINLMKINL